MVEVRRCHLGELDEIIDVANKSFIPVRYEGFDFRERMPKIYAANKDFSDMHFAVLEDEKMKAIAGNLISKVTLNNKEYPYSIVGTVSTLPSESNKGYMALLMKEIEKENIDKGIVFSMLTGKRQRYNRYGYERSGQRIIYQVNTHYYKHNEVNGSLVIRAYEEVDLNEIFNIYQKTQPMVLRNKDSFILDLRISNSYIYTILENDKVIGYFAIGDSLECIHELSLVDMDKLPIVMKEILKALNKEEIDVLVNPLNVQLCNSLEVICEGKRIEEEIMWKVYKWIPFIEMCLELNKNSKVFVDIKEVYRVDDLVVEIEVKDNRFLVQETNKKPIREFTSLEFIRFIIGNTTQYKNISLIFPLALDFNEGDMF